MSDTGFKKIQDSGYRIQDSGCGVQDAELAPIGSGIQDTRFRRCDSSRSEVWYFAERTCRIHGARFRYMIQDAGYMMQDTRYMIQDT
jgi:hypothetical protein